MKNLKTKLFEETLHHHKRWMELKKELGEWDNLVNVQHAKFSALYTIIEECGLEEEYQNWKNQEVISLEEMCSAIRTFIDENWGTDDGEHIYRKRCYIRDDDYDEIKKLYDEMLILYKAM